MSYVSERVRRMPIVPVLAVSLLSAAFWPVGTAASATDDPFEDIRGRWGGKGVMTLSEGRRERLACNAEYSGTSSLRLVIDCRNSDQAIKLRATLSSNAGRLAGTWSEKTYNVLGVIAGKASKNKISFNIGGGVVGRMTVSYSRNRQKVSIKVQNLPLKDVSINMARR